MRWAWRGVEGREEGEAIVAIVSQCFMSGSHKPWELGNHEDKGRGGDAMDMILGFGRQGGSDTEDGNA